MARSGRNNQIRNARRLKATLAAQHEASFTEFLRKATAGPQNTRSVMDSIPLDYAESFER